MQIVSALNQAKEKLQEKDSAELDAEVLLCSVLNYERSKLYAWPEQELSNKEMEAFNDLVSMRSKGHPVAHLTQQKEFWSIPLRVTDQTLIPRPETELLVETALELIPENKLSNILDLGTGTGAIAIAIATERPLTTITATDTNKNALNVAQENTNAYQIKNITFKQASWFEFNKNTSYDLIVSNPPYISRHDNHLTQGDVRYEPSTALVSGDDGLDDIRIIIKDAKGYLKKRGWLLLEHGYDQGDKVKQLFLNNDYRTVSTLKDYSKLDRVTLGQLQ